MKIKCVSEILTDLEYKKEDLLKIEQKFPNIQLWEFLDKKISVLVSKFDFKDIIGLDLDLFVGYVIPYTKYNDKLIYHIDYIDYPDDKSKNKLISLKEVFNLFLHEDARTLIRRIDYIRNMKLKYEI